MQRKYGLKQDINGPQQKQLCEALLSAFPKRQDLERMDSYGLNENLSAIVRDSDLRHTVFELIQWSITRGRLDELLTAAIQENNRNHQLLSVAKQLVLVIDQHFPLDLSNDETVLSITTSSSPTLGSAYQQALQILNQALDSQKRADAVLMLADMVPDLNEVEKRHLRSRLHRIRIEESYHANEGSDLVEDYITRVLGILDDASVFNELKFISTITRVSKLM